MLLQQQCLWIILANVNLFSSYGDQSVIVWEKPKQRKSISVAETNLNLKQVIGVLKSLNFKRSKFTNKNYNHFCTKGLSETDLGELQGKTTSSNIQRNLRLYHNWLSRTESDRLKFYTTVIKTSEYNKCIDLYKDKDISRIEFTTDCDHEGLLLGIAAGQIGIKGKNNCFAPHTGISFHIFTPHGFPLTVSRASIRYRSRNIVILILPLMGEAYSLRYDKRKDMYYIEERSGYSGTKSVGASHEDLKKITHWHSGMVSIPERTVLKIGCKAP